MFQMRINSYLGRTLRFIISGLVTKSCICFKHDGQGCREIHTGLLTVQYFLVESHLFTLCLLKHGGPNKFILINILTKFPV